jgi:hypothetical protein
MTTKIKTIDESQDQRYFTITPRLVWALSRSPFDFTLWSTIKGIAGEAGECYLTTDDLAILSMMSTGQVSDSRKYWIRTGLLHGDFRKDPGYPQPVWHMRIPNIWKENIDWAEKFTGLKERVEYKRSQMDDLREKRLQKRLEYQEKSSLHPVKPSPGEEGVTPGEEGVTPGETKNIHKEIKKDIVDADAPALPEEPQRRTDAVVKGDIMDGILYFAALAQQQADKQGLPPDILDRIDSFPADCKLGARLMYVKFKVIPPEKPKSGKGGDYADWINGIRDLEKLCSEYHTSIHVGFEKAFEEWNKSPFIKDRPGSLIKVMRSALSTMLIRDQSAVPATLPTVKVQADNPVPNPLPRPKTLVPKSLRAA